MMLLFIQRKTFFRILNSFYFLVYLKNTSETLGGETNIKVDYKKGQKYKQIQNSLSAEIFQSLETVYCSQRKESKFANTNTHQQL